MTPREGSVDSLAACGSARSMLAPPMSAKKRGPLTPGSPVSSTTEDSPSGRGRTLGKRVKGNLSGVQIPHPPPAQKGCAVIMAHPF